MANSIQEKKQKLRKTCSTIKLMQEIGEFPQFATMNQALVHLYRDQIGNPQADFKTFNAWKKEGKKVKKGSKAFVIWGSAIKANKESSSSNAQEETSSKDEFEFFPICHVFSSDQVE